MKRSIFYLAVAVLLASLAGCGQGRQVSAAEPVPYGIEAVDEDQLNQTHALNIVATIFPPYDFIRQVAGDRVELTMLLPPGSESHSYEPSPQDIIAIQECDVFVYVGGESDDWVDRILESMDTSGMETIALIDLVATVEEEIVEGMQTGDGEEDDHGHSEEEPELDEHVWTSPRNAIHIVQALSNTLCQLDGENAELYQANTREYLEELEELDREFGKIAAEAARHTLVFGDRFPFRYLADAYGLDYYAAFPGCSTETEASAATVAFLIDKVREEEIPAVFFIEFSNEKMADTICESTGAEKLLLHSCHNLTKQDFENGATYLELMRRNAANLREALE